MPSTTTAVVTAKLKCMFARFGIRFRDFAEKLGFGHQTTSPYFPQANGQAERAVQIAKNILCQADPMMALLAYRSTPHSATGFTPAELLMGRKIQSTLPSLPESLQPRWPDPDVIAANDKAVKESYAHYYNRGTRPLSDLKEGERVRVKRDSQKTWSSPAIIRHKADAPRSYYVESPVVHFLGVTDVIYREFPHR